MKILTTAAIVLAIVAGVAAAILGFRSDSQAAQLTQLRAAVHAEQTAVRQDQARITGLSGQVSGLSTQVDNLNVPTDPLSAYNAVCNQPMTTSAGVTETYWFPCTNSAQTIPQPGN